MQLILIIAWLFAEAWSIGYASDKLGGFAVFVILVLIAVAGSRLIQHQGLRSVQNIQLAMHRNELPALAMLDAVIVFVAGVLLIVPGFVSDFVALILLFGGVRRRIAQQAERQLNRRYPDYATAVVIEGEYQTVEQHEPLPRVDENNHPPS